MYNKELVNIKIIFCCTLIWFGERLKISTFKNHPVHQGHTTSTNHKIKYVLYDDEP